MYTTMSLWESYAGSTDYPTLQQNIHTDTLIIGGGITGISLGMQLSSAKQQAIIIEERKIGGGTSSHSTGNLYITIDQLLSTLRDKYDNEQVLQVLASRLSALTHIKNTVEHHQLACDFQVCPWYLYAVDESDGDRIEKELKIAKEAGIEMEKAAITDMPYAALKAIKLMGQAQINPMKYVQELAKAIDPAVCRIFENTPAIKIEKNGDVYEVSTPQGMITATNLVHATHTPKGAMFLQTMLGPYREYGIAFKAKGKISAKGIFWGYHDGKKYSTRTYEQGDDQYILVIGNPHKVGQNTNSTESIREIEDFAREHFQVDDIAFRWGGQHYRPADLLPYIGRKENNLFVATGYSTDGLVYGTLAGMIISDQLMGKENQWTKLYDPSRTDPLKSAKNFLKENLNVARQYMDLLPGMRDDLELADVAEGEGKVIDREGHKLAVYRDHDQQLQVRSAICPHLGCVVKFNDAEKTWDCPCHGSRFKTDGSVIEGPALHPLQGLP